LMIGDGLYYEFREQKRISIRTAAVASVKPRRKSDFIFNVLFIFIKL
jgi:hypothetical protein